MDDSERLSNLPKIVQLASDTSGILNPKAMFFTAVLPCLSVSQGWKGSASKPVSEGPRNVLMREGKETECRKGLHVDGACKEERWWETNEKQGGGERRCLKEGMVREWGSGCGESWGLGSRSGIWQQKGRNGA